ncbi:AAA family ATPase [Sessilibacter corallicola]|uniref:MoxR family ATPase n=1 Tax=Sessilibacter corallicola TaxID=2904075 RepID=A0ABQ0A9Q4_9GAMM
MSEYQEASKTLFTQRSENISFHREDIEHGNYHLTDQHIGAIQAAFLSNRPLLVRGDPGLGKSQLAYAIASILDWGVVKAVVQYNTTVESLLYDVDHIERLHFANLQTQSKQNLSVNRFLKPGKIWQAIAPNSLDKLAAEVDGDIKPPHEKGGTVLLIDEIDKADSSLPNALLDVLDTGEISCPYTNFPIKASQEQHPYMVVVTSNEERLLPMAFIRRCAILDLTLDNKEQLIAIYNAHQFNDEKLAELSSDLVEQVADFIFKQRSHAKDYKPGTSEFLDTLRALSQFDKEERTVKLETLKQHLITKKQQRN